jgi:succinate-acetate transporter protein
MAEVAELRDFRLVEQHQSWTPGGPVVSRLPDPEIEVLEGRAMSTVSEPGTLALFGFATGTWMAGAVFGTLASPAAQAALAVVLILFAGLAQFIAGLFTFRRTNMLNANTFCSYGAYNMVVGFMLLLEASGFLPRGDGTATILGWFNISFGFISLALMIAGMKRNWAMVGVLFGLTCGYTLIGISQFYVGPEGATTANGVAVAGGALLFLAAFCAYYVAMALAVNSTWKRPLLPLFGEA